MALRLDENKAKMAMDRCPGPIQNSEVYVLSGQVELHQPRAAPPSPPTPCETRSISPVSDAGDKLKLLSIPSPVINESSQTSEKFEKRLKTAVHVLNTEATALQCLTRLYESDSLAREGFSKSVDVMKRAVDKRGKVVICGVGKSGHIAKKMVATMNSLRVPATYLHPTEALHGDLGKVSEYDVILLITFSGKTPELLQLVPHFNPLVPLIVLTAHIHPSTCKIINQRPDAVLLPSPIHESETDSFGVSAPTTSTTIALALGDALAVAISEELHPSVSEVFSRNHPGGAIGHAASRSSQPVSSLACELATIPFAFAPSAPEMSMALTTSPPSPASSTDSSSTAPAMRAMHVLISGYQSPSGWVRYSDGSVVPPRRIRRLTPADLDLEATKVKGLVVERREWFPVEESMTVKDVMELLKGHISAAECNDDVVVVTTRNGNMVGVVEVATLLGV